MNKHTFFSAGAALSLIASALSFAETPPDRYTIVRCGTLLASADQPARQRQTLVIKNDKVEAILDGFDPPALTSARGAGAAITEVDLSDKYVLPGLIDCHVHLTMEFDRELRMREFTESDPFVTLRAAVYARRDLDAGFTTVRDLGTGRPDVVFALRDAIQQGMLIGPRIVAAGHAISITGGHGDGTTGTRQQLVPIQRPEDGIADGPDECRKAVRFQIKIGADVIKVTATGGVLSVAKAGLAQQEFDDELAAIVATAHSLQRKVAAHAHGSDGINAAIRAGVDSIEHGTYLDDESIALFKQHNCYHVPTLLAVATVVANAEKPGFYPAVVADKARLVGPRAMEMFRKSHDAGVKIAFGTDTGVSPHGMNAKEFKLMVDAGMPPAEAIQAATRNAAEVLGMSAEIGAIAPGHYADIVVVAGDPIADITQLEHPLMTYKDGVAYAPLAATGP